MWAPVCKTFVYFLWILSRNSVWDFQFSSPWEKFNCTIRDFSPDKMFIGVCSPSPPSKGKDVGKCVGSVQRVLRRNMLHRTGTLDKVPCEFLLIANQNPCSHRMGMHASLQDGTGCIDISDECSMETSMCVSTLCIYRAPVPLLCVGDDIFISEFIREKNESYFQLHVWQCSVP